MPRKPLDSRLLVLALKSRTAVEAHPSLEPVPGVVVPDYDKRAWPWAWADVTVSASYHGITRLVTVKGKSWRDRDEFERSQDYAQAVTKVLGGLLHAVDEAARAAAELGGR